MSRHENSQLGPDTRLSRRSLFAGALATVIVVASGCSPEGSSGRPDIPSANPGEASKPSPKHRAETPEIEVDDAELFKPKSVIWSGVNGDQPIKIETVPPTVDAYGVAAYGVPESYMTLGWDPDNSPVGGHIKVMTVHTTTRQGAKSLLDRKKFEERLDTMEKAGESMEMEFQGENGETATYTIHSTAIYTASKLDSTGKGDTEYGRLIERLYEQYRKTDAIVLITCAGEPSYEIGTSETAVVLVGVRKT